MNQGINRWNQFSKIEAEIVSGGKLFEMKGVPQDDTPRQMTVWLHEQKASVHPQPGLLEKVPSLIITEGKNDYYTLKYINQFYFNNKFKALRFYPGDGANSNNSTIRLYLAWGKKFYILLDADKKGKDAKNDYLKSFGIEVQDKVFTYSDIDITLDGSAVEALFTPTEQLKITQHFDSSATSYEKGKFNTAIQNLLFSKQKINLGNETLERFDKIFSFLENQLKK